jgi:Tfp pilus assembly protein PilV
MVKMNMPNKKQRGAIMAELIVAMSVLVIAMLPLSYAAISNTRELRTTYQKAIATEIVDGEIEILAADTTQQIEQGTNTYDVHANAATNLPPGQFQISRNGNLVRLQWTSAKKIGIGPIVREVRIQ